MQTKYLLDANIFIESHNLHYHPSFCEKFWDWIVSGHKEGIFYSIDRIKGELVHQAKSDDELSIRLREERIPSDFFIPSLPDPIVAQQYGHLMGWLDSKTTHYLPKAIKEFQDHKIADPFLVATAMAHNYVIVTKEKSNPEAKNRVKIPDAASENQVKCITLQQLLRRHAHNDFEFIL
ncbi:DUF4411 family protein [Acinetobacter guillouiae]|uniref:DUF4411 family protein n=1 Tax=Acinetobacter guillouiae TaxID=106649 RepID=UPI003AF764C8